MNIVRPSLDGTPFDSGCLPSKMLRERTSITPFDEVSIPVRLRNQKILKRIATCSLEAKIKAAYYDPYSIKGQSFYETSGLVYRTKDCLVLSFHPEHTGSHVAKIYCDGSEFGPAIKFTVNNDGKPVMGEAKSRPPSNVYGSVGRGIVPSSSVYSNAASVAASSMSYGTVGRVQGSGSGSTPNLGHLPPSSAFTMNYLAPQAPLTDPMEGLNDAQQIQQQKRTANTLTFSELYKLKCIGVEDSFMEPSKRAGVESTMKNGLVTSETLKMLQDEAKMLTEPHAARKRCQICRQQHKVSKFMTIWETDFCLMCVKLTFMQHSFIEHFMVPTVQDCSVTVPIDKKGKKMATVKKRLPVVNLRGLSPQEVKFAQEEFKKFDIENIGWIDKAVLLPLVKSVFAFSLKEQEIKSFLSGATLRAMLVNMGIELRDHVHQIEFLGIVAFVAREVQMAIPSKNPYTRFTPQDLQMAFAFQVKYGVGNVSEQVKGLKQQDKAPRPQRKDGVNRDSTLSHKLPTSTSFEWQRSPGNTIPLTTPPKDGRDSSAYARPTPPKGSKKPTPTKQSKSDRPKSGSPIYEAIPDNSATEGISPRIEEEEENPESPSKVPQLPPSVSFFRKNSKKGEQSARLAPIGGVTKTNPLLHEVEASSDVSSQEEGLQTSPDNDHEFDDLNLPTKGIDDLGLTGSPADAWMMY